MAMRDSPRSGQRPAPCQSAPPLHTHSTRQRALPGRGNDGSVYGQRQAQVPPWMAGTGRGGSPPNTVCCPAVLRRERVATVTGGSTGARPNPTADRPQFAGGGDGRAGGANDHDRLRRVGSRRRHPDGQHHRRIHRPGGCSVRLARTCPILAVAAAGQRGGGQCRHRRGCPDPGSRLPAGRGRQCRHERGYDRGWAIH